MVITLDAELEAALSDLAKRQGLPPETLARQVLRDRLITSSFQARDEWERLVLGIGSDCGVSLSNEALSSEGLYD
jgi:hypothetical protein